MPPPTSLRAFGHPEHGGRGLSATPIADMVEKFRLNSRCLYVISESRDGPVKIGTSADPAARLRQLQTGNPRRLRIFYICRLDPEDANHAERDLHSELGRRMAGEWFDYDEAFILEYMPDFWLSIGLEIEKAA